MKRNKQQLILFSLIILSIFYILWYWMEYTEYAQSSQQTRTLKKDGFCVFINREYLKNPLLLQADILHSLPEGYIFLDYIYKIHNTSLSTFHRDVTSSQQIYHTKYPVYTLILYKYSGELLSVCPRSNQTYPWVTSNIVNIRGEAGTAFLFDCELLHAGMKNNCREREVIQYKLCHQEDAYLLRHLNNIDKTKTDVCKVSLYESGLRKISYYFQLPINTFLYPLMIKKQKDTSIGYIQSFIPITFYNNE